MKASLRFFNTVFMGMLLFSFSGCQHGKVKPELSVTMEELAPLNLKVVGRQLKISIEVKHFDLACKNSSKPVTLGLLIDADKKKETGWQDKDFGEIGFDANLALVCDPATGTFTSSLTPAAITPQQSGDSLIFSVETIVDKLPSVDFYFIVYARNGKRFLRYPPAPDFTEWKILERRMF